MIANLLLDFKKAAAIACVAAAGLSSAAEAAELVNIGELQNGVPTEYPGGYVQVAASFKVPEDGPVRVVCTGTFLTAYSTETHDTDTELPNEFSYVDGKPMRIYECKKDDMLYFYNNFSMTGGTITVTSGEMKLRLLSTSPSTDPDSPAYYGGAYSVSADYRINFSFNQPIEIGGARLIANGQTTSLSPNVYLTAVEVDVADILMNLYRTGGLKKGDTIRVEVFGAQEKDNPDNKLDGTGVAAVEYVMAAQPIELVSTENTPASGVPDMLSYYLPGNPRAKVKYTFSGPVASGDMAPDVKITYGDMDNLDAGMYYENLPTTVEGNTVTFDLAGKLRRPQEMLPKLTDPLDYISVALYNVRGEDGQYAYTGSMSNPYNYFIDYKLTLLQYNIAADYTPGQNKALAEGTDMEIFIMDGDKIEFDTVDFAYLAGGEEKTVSVAKDDLKISFEQTTDMVINLKAPALPGIDENSDVKVTLGGLLCADGLDHAEALTCVYSSYTSGIYTVGADAEQTADVYNAQGVPVLRNATPAQIRTLPAGLYIAGGRKIIVK